MATAPQCSSKTQSAAEALLAWYDLHRRVLPWRARPGEHAAPYRVWLSEIMLQQTTVQAVERYYREFLERWPTVQALAAAPMDDVLAAWAGLGYYARARNLHKAAKVVVEEFAGEFPAGFEKLKKIPGVGTYTAGAIAAIAFDLPFLAMDANAERVLARLFAIEEALPKAKARLRGLGQQLVPHERPGDFAQALMDLGAGVCTPKRPACGSCPVNAHCEAFKRGIQDRLPLKGEKPVRPLKRGAAFVARDSSGAVLLVKRPENGLLGGMLQPPLGPWTDEFPSVEAALAQAPFPVRWHKRTGIVRHGFTHFELEIEVYVAEVKTRPGSPPVCGGSTAEGGEGGERKRPLHHAFREHARACFASHGPPPPLRGGGTWVAEGDLPTAALPTVMRKIIAHALDGGGPLFAQASAARRR